MQKRISAKVFGLLIAYLMITKDRKPVSQRLKTIESRIREKINPHSLSTQKKKKNGHSLLAKNLGNS